MADEHQRKPDAIRLPSGFGGGGDMYERAVRITRAAGPMLGAGEGDRVYLSNQGSFTLATLSPSFQLYYPNDHARARQSKYDWVEATGGISYGYLRPDEPAAADLTLPPPPGPPKS